MKSGIGRFRVVRTLTPHRQRHQSLRDHGFGGVSGATQSCQQARITRSASPRAMRRRDVSLIPAGESPCLCAPLPPSLTWWAEQGDRVENVPARGRPTWHQRSTSSQTVDRSGVRRPQAAGVGYCGGCVPAPPACVQQAMAAGRLALCAIHKARPAKTTSGPARHRRAGPLSERRVTVSPSDRPGRPDPRRRRRPRRLLPSRPQSGLPRLPPASSGAGPSTSSG